MKLNIEQFLFASQMNMVFFFVRSNAKGRQIDLLILSKIIPKYFNHTDYKYLTHVRQKKTLFPQNNKNVFFSFSLIKYIIPSLTMNFQFYAVRSSVFTIFHWLQKRRFTNINIFVLNLNRFNI